MGDLPLNSFTSSLLLLRFFVEAPFFSHEGSHSITGHISNGGSFSSLLVYIEWVPFMGGGARPGISLYAEGVYHGPGVGITERAFSVQRSLKAYLFN